MRLQINLLCYEPVEVWKYGPVFPSIFHTFRNSYGVTRDKPAKLLNKDYPFNEKELFIIKRTYDIYGRFSSNKLSEITHKGDTPWSTAKTQKRGVIDNAIIAQHYKGICQV